MRITESQLRRIIRQEVRSLREAAGGPVELGRLRASIPGDSRYTDTLTVSYDPASDTVSVKIGATVALGGMDTLGGATTPFGGGERAVPADPRAVMAEINRAINDSEYLFKRYGKPTRNFKWMTGEMGLSTAKVAAALEAARGGM
jgi:hypothetical protein